MSKEVWGALFVIALLIGIAQEWLRTDQPWVIRRSVLCNPLSNAHLRNPRKPEPPQSGDGGSCRHSRHGSTHRHFAAGRGDVLFSYWPFYPFTLRPDGCMRVTTELFRRCSSTSQKKTFMTRGPGLQRPANVRLATERICNAEHRHSDPRLQQGVGSYPELVPWFGQVTPGLVLCLDGSLLAMFEYNGIDMQHGQ